MKNSRPIDYCHVSKDNLETEHERLTLMVSEKFIVGNILPAGGNNNFSHYFNVYHRDTGEKLESHRALRKI